MRINTISIIISILAIAVAGFTLFRNPDQIPYGATLPIQQEEIQLDTVSIQELAGAENLEPYRVYRVYFETANYIDVKKEGLPTYDSLQVAQMNIKNVIQRGAFNRQLFENKTKGLIRIVYVDVLRR